MKKSTYFFGAILLCTVLFFSCKKKDKKEEPAPTPAPVTPAHVNSMTAKLNGTNWAMYVNNGVPASVASRSGLFYYFSGSTAYNTPYTSVRLNFYPATGTFTFSQFSNYYASYDDGTNTFTSKTGTINISQLDTTDTYGLPKIFKCTFSFMTDTISGQHFNVTEGMVDYKTSS